MQKKISRFSVLLLSVLVLCLLLSPAAMAAEYKLYQACPQPAQQSCKQNTNSNTSTSCKQNVNTSTSASCPQNSNCNNSTTCKQGVSCNNQTYCQPKTTCGKSQAGQLVQVVKPSQSQTTTCVKPAQTTTASQGAANNTAAAKPSTTVSTSSYAAEVVRLVNEERAKQGLAALTMDSTLSAAAGVRAKEINTKFSHTRPNGKSCFTALSEQGATSRRAGENIAIGQASPATVVKAWMDSPGHRANILGDYTKIGVAVEKAGGSFNGYAWAQFFTK